MTSRILPPAEWSRLTGTDMDEIARRLPATCGAQILVVEAHDQIVATWALIPMMHAEGLWIHPQYRRRFGVVARLLRGMRALAQRAGLAAVWTGAISPEVEDFIHRLGGRPLPGRAFLLPMRG